MYCPKCGAWVKEGFVFCESCGARLSGSAEPVSVPGTQPVKRSGQRSGGMAAAWILVGALALVVIVLGVLALLRSRGDRTPQTGAAEIIVPAVQEGAQEPADAPAASLRPEKDDETEKQTIPTPPPTETPAETEAPAGDEAPPLAEKNQPFYGIWVFAAEKEADAEAQAAMLRGYGLDARVFHTTDWSNLNAKSYYCVSVGAYATEEEANSSLEMVKGYVPDAYVKYSGEWKGD